MSLPAVPVVETNRARNHLRDESMERTPDLSVLEHEARPILIG